jgi:hypothetical protein
MFLLRPNFNEFYQKNSNFSKTGKIIFMFLPISLTLRAPHVSFHVSCLGKHAAEANHQSQSQNTRRHAQDRAEAGHNPRENVGADSKILQSKAHAARTRHD